MEKMDKQKIFEYLVSDITDRLVRYINETYHLSWADSLGVLYNSHTYAALTNRDLQLYVESPNYVCEVLKSELARYDRISSSQIVGN
jgi:hypothetical protein